MEVLIVTDKNCYNPYPCELAQCISGKLTSGSITVDINEFLESNSHFDIIHIQWIEEIFEWNNFNTEKFSTLLKRIDYWKQKGAAIVCTIHNILPHSIPRKSGFEIYRKVFQKTDLFIHLGEASKKMFQEMYGNALINSGRHVVIPHGLYSTFKKNVDKTRARSYFGINENDFVMLAFGRIRTCEEEKLIFDAYRALESKRKKVIVSNYKFSCNRLSRIIQKTKLAVNKGVIARSGFVKKDMVPYYFAASDIVIIPRIEALNSGNLLLGFFYEKVLTGPDSGVVGEILKETVNPVFVAHNKKSLSDAVNEAKRLAENTNKGYENFLFANKRYNWRVVSEMHLKAYESVIINK